MQFSRPNSLVEPLRGRPVTNRECSILDEAIFRRMIAVERKRTERSRQPFLLLLLDTGNFLPSDRNGHVLSQVLTVLSRLTRETDVTGWYKTRSVIGVMFTEICIDERGSILSTVMNRVSEALRHDLTIRNFSQISISLHVFPENWDQDATQGNLAFYPDLIRRNQAQSTARIIKRLIDVLGSLAALALGAPILLLVALLVKLSSKGPILFRQERLGQFGKTFTFLKFRSMYANNNHKIHEEFMKNVIKGKHDGRTDDTSKVAYKMTKDPRITKIGSFLRRTSLDELPQFINVLKGDMSLVGPRPPIAYECEEYDIWHRRRILEVKPGITGLWQIKGRSRIPFDEMVRLDLQYAQTWSLWLDIKILLQTPRALFSDTAF